MKTKKIIPSVIISLTFTLGLLLISENVSAKKCPPGSFWVAKHTGPKGKIIPGHCKVRDKVKKALKECPDGSKWIPRHRGPNGKLIPGHCK